MKTLLVTIEIDSDLLDDGLEPTAERLERALHQGFPYARSGGLRVARVREVAEAEAE